MSPVTSAWAAWRPLVRIARRDALRARGRSALIVAMVALPILAMTASDVLVRSAQLEPNEVVARRLGTTQAELESWSGRPLVQAPDPQTEGAAEVSSSENTSAPSPYPDVAALAAAAPGGYRVLTAATGEVLAHTRDGLTRSEWDEVDVGDAAFAGRYVVKAGTAPTTSREVAVSPDLFDQLGVPVGGTVRLEEPSRTLTLSGVVAQVGARGERFWARPGTLLGTAVTPTGTPMIWLDGPRPVTWTEVQALNRVGLLVTSRQVLLDPPPVAQVPYYQAGNTPGTGNAYWLLVMVLAVVVLLAGLEVCLLAGAAFAVGARRQARSLGLLAAAGGSRGHVRSVVLAGGLVLGAVGAVVGVLLGLVLAAVARPVLTAVSSTDFGRYDVRPLELLGIALVGLGTGVLAAVLPARTAARQDPVVALTGRRGQVRTPRKVPVIGVVVVVVGVGCAALGSALAVAYSTGLNPLNGSSTALVATLIGGGAALAQIGLIVTSPAIIGLAGRWSGRLPLPARLALRDAARHRGRSAPAMAAVLTAVTGSTALVLYVASMDAHDRDSYHPSWPARTGAVALETSTYDSSTGEETRFLADPGRALAALTPVLPSFRPHVVRVVDLSCATSTTDCAPGSVTPVVPPDQACFVDRLDHPLTPDEQRLAEADPACNGGDLAVSGSFPGTPVGGAEVLRAVTRRPPSAQAVRTLAAGGVVVFQKKFLRPDGTVRYDVISAEEATRAQAQNREPHATHVSVPGTYVRVTEAAADSVLSPRAADRLGLRTEPSTLLLSFGTLPTRAQQEKAQQALTNAGLRAYLSVERGYVSQYGLGLLALVVGAGVITLGSAGIATGLAQADARPDQATLAAVGAAPRLRRTLAAAQALSIAVLGTALGVAAGFVPAVALIAAIPGLSLVVPGWQLLEILVAIPLLAAGSAWLLTRSRVPLERRVG